MTSWDPSGEKIQGRQIVLFLAANPFDVDHIAFDREARAIAEELERGHRTFELAIRAAAQPIDLLREVRRLKPTIVHFRGHGGKCRDYASASPGDVRRDHESMPASADEHGLFLVASDGRAQFVSAVALERTICAAGGSIRLIVLNACYSEDLARILTSHVDCIIGMRGAIGDDAARNFSIGFYGGVGEGESVAAAYRQGLAAISLHELSDDAHPRLRNRDGVDPERMFLTIDHASRPLSTPANSIGDASRVEIGTAERPDASTPVAVRTAASTEVASLDDVERWGWSSTDLLEKLVALDHELIGGTLNDRQEGSPEHWAPLFWKNADSWRLVVDRDRNILGYWEMHPLTEEAFELARTGRLIDGELEHSSVLFFDIPGCYDVYFSMIGLVHSARSTGIVMRLLKSLLSVILDLSRRSVYIRNVVAATWTPDGETLCKQLNMRKSKYCITVERSRSVPIYTGTMKRLLSQPIADAFPALKRQYDNCPCD